jgi:hypothetical protein
MADVKQKFLDQGGVSVLWSKIVEKVAADVDVEAKRAAGAEQGLATSIENLENYVGTIPEGSTATNVVDYVKEKTNGIATDAALGELRDAVDAIEADYLKAADKTELSNAISAADGKAVNAQNAVDALSAKVGEVTEGKTVVEMIADAQSAATYDDTALANRVTTLEGNDAGKSVRAIANEELAKQLIAEGAQESLDTLAEIAAWIQAHPDDASAMNAAIAALQAKVDTGDKTVSAYVTDAIAALSIGDYAKAADLVALAGRVTAIENDYLKAADKTALNEAIALKADQTALEAEETARKNAVQANADAIAAIKDHTVVDSFADVMNEISKKQDIIEALSAEDIDAAIAAAI